MREYDVADAARCASAPTTASAGARRRGPGWILAGLGPSVAAVVGTGALVVVRDEPTALVLTALLGVVVVLLNLASAATTERGFQMWVLPRRGVTVTAERTSPYGKSGVYRYTDPSGTSHTYSRQAYASRIRISHHPDDPRLAVGVYPVVVRVLAALGSLALWAATAGLVYLMFRMGNTI
ncbi:hypothetical protein [Streptomyces showdoensis]|uniref:DUF3592 domain-containing protein n=1 Tax=Streptomyces showdoensis TaxID=68268 RepID=A0A2P2GXD2_STREW|nr:hypothetical protein [Streptomyces showdoensis]KKZ75579.1 hypothetical protein VO63_01785 [Streptomyces showdoensis]